MPCPPNVVNDRLTLKQETPSEVLFYIWSFISHANAHSTVTIYEKPLVWIRDFVVVYIIRIIDESNGNEWIKFLFMHSEINGIDPVEH